MKKLLTAAMAAMALLTPPLAPAVQAKGTASKTNLIGSPAFPRARGNARFRFNPQFPPSTTTVTVENGTPGTTADIRLDGVSIGSLTFDKSGTGTTAIPGLVAPVAGKQVVAYTADGILIASGWFQ